MLFMAKSLFQKYIINHVENIRNIYPLMKQISIDYCGRICNREADGIAKSAHS